MNRRRLFLVVSAAAVVLLGAPSLGRADEFAQGRLASGIDAFRAKRYAEASDQFRIACFGLLDQPVLLTEGLVRLALSQEAAGRRADVEKTLNRFLEVERRFAGYANSHLEAPTRAEFQTLLRARVPVDAIAAVPSLARPPAQVGGRADELIEHPALAQSATGSISGTVLDTAGAPLPEASVTAKHVKTGAVRNAKTNATGAFLFSPVPVGVYEVSSSLQGFAPSSVGKAEVAVGAETIFRITMVRADVKSTLAVTEEAPVVETTKSEQASAVSEVDIQNRPANGRNVSDSVLTTSGVTPPVALDTPAPAYPELAWRARAEGDVVVEAMIGADGSVSDARVLRSASRLLEPAALEAVRRWRYRPARVGERPVATSIRVIVTFSRRNLKAWKES